MTVTNLELWLRIYPVRTAHTVGEHIQVEVFWGNVNDVVPFALGHFTFLIIQILLLRVSQATWILLLEMKINKRKRTPVGWSNILVNHYWNTKNLIKIWLDSSSGLKMKLRCRVSSVTMKYYWLCRSQLDFKVWIFFYTWEDNISPTLLQAVPKNVRKEVLKSCHDSKLVGHLGQVKTVNIIRESLHVTWYKQKLQWLCEVM